MMFYGKRSPQEIKAEIMRLISELENQQTAPDIREIFNLVFKLDNELKFFHNNRWDDRWYDN